MLLKHAFSQAGAQRTRDGDGGGWRHLLPLGWCLNVDGTQVTVSTVAVSPKLIIIRTVTSSHTQSLDVCQYRIRSKLLSQLADFLFSAAAAAATAAAASKATDKPPFQACAVTSPVGPLPLQCRVTGPKPARRSSTALCCSCSRPTTPAASSRQVSHKRPSLRV